MKSKIIISVDGIRKDRLGCYSSRNNWLTPNFTRIAPKCVRFDNMIAAATSTGMCFASVFTGRYPVDFGRKTYGDTKTPFPDNVFSDHEALGYKTIVCLNKRFDVHARLIKAFSKAEFWWTGTSIDESVKKTKDDSSLRPKDQATYFIERSDKIQKPFLAWLHLWGFSSPQKRFTEITPFEYDARIAELDEAVGILFDHFCDSCEIFIFADHGYTLFEHGRWAYGKDGHCLTESVISVPLLVYNSIQQGVNPFLVSHARLREIIYNSNCSLEVRDDIVFCETRYIEQPDLALAIRQGPYKLIYYYDTKRHEFYDLTSDPHENINYASDSFHKLKRNKDGTHPQLKPYILRTDWDKLAVLEQDLLRRAREYYGSQVFSWKRRLRGFLQSSTITKRLSKAIRGVYKKLGSI